MDINGNVWISSVLAGINTKIFSNKQGLLEVCINKEKDFIYYSSSSEPIPTLYGEVRFYIIIGSQW